MPQMKKRKEQERKARKKGEQERKARMQKRRARRTPPPRPVGSVHTGSNITNGHPSSSRLTLMTDPRSIQMAPQLRMTTGTTTPIAVYYAATTFYAGTPSLATMSRIKPRGRPAAFGGRRFRRQEGRSSLSRMAG